MPQQVWRVCRRKYIATAFTGDGARQVGGRWTPPGAVAVYTSGTLSLAILEMLVHMEQWQLGGHVAIPAIIPDRLIETLAPGKLPSGWDSIPAPPELQTIGVEWLRAGTSAALCVPSAVVSIEHNYLLNPNHLDFGQIEIGEAIKMPADTRLP